MFLTFLLPLTVFESIFVAETSVLLTVVATLVKRGIFTAIVTIIRAKLIVIRSIAPSISNVALCAWRIACVNKNL